MKYPLFKKKDLLYLRINTHNIDTLALKLIPPRARVLEIGCGDGRLTWYLCKKLFCEVHTVELDRDNAKNAKPFARKIIIGDIEDKSVFTCIKENGSYDIVYASGVITSLISPERIVRNLKTLLRKDGKIIVTFPNIAHWTVRKKLLMGTFAYEDTGICFSEHLHFYTIDTARQLITQAGYTIEHMVFDYVGFPRLEKSCAFWPKLPEFLYRAYALFPGLFTHQMVFEIRPL